jgi:hypothetical protein
VTPDISRIRKYLVSGPEGPFGGNPHHNIYVEWRGQRYGKGPVLWAVTNGCGDCMNKRGRWEFEPQPSSRTDAFLKRCRWESFHEAYCAAAGALTIAGTGGEKR